MGARVGLVVCAGARIAASDPEGAKNVYAIAYEAPAECPSAEQFVEQVTLRVGSDRISSNPKDARTLRVEVRRQHDEFLGTLSVGKSSRALRAQSCAEAAKALALAAAIVIDPEAALNSTPKQESTPATSERAPNQALAAPTAPVQAPSPAATSSAAPPALPAHTRDRTLPPSNSRDALWLSAGPSLDLRSAIASDLVLAPGAFADLELSRESLLAPSLRIAASGTLGTENAPLGDAQLRLIGVRLDACPLRLRPARSVDVKPCGTFEIGQRRIVAHTSAESESETRLWAAPGTAVRGRFMPVKELALELQAASYVPLDRTTITFADQSTNQRQVRSAPSIGFSIGAALATRFTP